MGKKVVAVFGNLVIKMDAGSTDSHDRKPPHVSFVENGWEKYDHIYLDDVDDLAGNDRNEKDAIYWLRKHKKELIAEYNRLNC